MSKPMPMAQRSAITSELNAAAESLRLKLNCTGVMSVVLVADKAGGGYYHIVQGGAGMIPGRLADFLRTLVTMAEAGEIEHEGFVQ